MVMTVTKADGPGPSTTPARIRLFDLDRQQASIADELHAAFDAFIASGIYVKGPLMEAFEREFAAYCGVAHGIGVSSGTTGLELIYRAYGIGPGDEVIVPANTSVATAMAVSNVGARPVIVDVDPRTANIDPACVEAAITPRTRAVVPVHLWGRPAAMNEVLAVARKHGLRVFEDASQAHGARYHGRRVGGLADAAAFSLHPSKNLGALGDSGIVLTGDSQIATAIAEMRDLGQSARYVHTRIGTNGRLDPLHAAMLSVKLRHLDEWLAGRRAAAARYTELFAGTPVRTPVFAEHEFAVFHLFVVEVPQREKICAALDRERIDWGIHYPTTIQHQGAYRGQGVAPRPTPHADGLGERILSLPMYAELTAADTARVAAVVLDAIGGS
jgi:dTDP-4-amino-4,6-dideoxygalactose transaminase